MQNFTETVIHWKALGRTIGFPTANLKLTPDFIAEWTYKINIVYNWKIYHWVGTARNSLELFEAHIFNFKKMIYGEKVEIIILEKLRDNEKFNSLEEIKTAIKWDVAKAKQTKNTVMSFGTFDIFHPWHNYFLSEAKKYGDELLVVIATDKNVKKLKGKLPKNNETLRLQAVKSVNIADKVLLGDEENPMKWIELYTPKVVCLGYDQIGFSEKLKENFPEIEIVRIGSFEPETYKSSKLK